MHHEDETANHHNWNAQAYRVYLASEHRKNNAESREAFLEDYRGEWASEAAYAKRYYEDQVDMSAIPSFMESHIDWEGVAGELFSGTVYSDDSSDCGIFVFDNR